MGSRPQRQLLLQLHRPPWKRVAQAALRQHCRQHSMSSMRTTLQVTDNFHLLVVLTACIPLLLPAEKPICLQMVAKADTSIEHAFPASMPELAQCSILCATKCPDKQMHCAAEDPHHIPLIHVDWPNSSSTDQLNPGDRCAPEQNSCISRTPCETLWVLPASLLTRFLLTAASHIRQQMCAYYLGSASSQCRHGALAVQSLYCALPVNLSLTSAHIFRSPDAFGTPRRLGKGLRTVGRSLKTV